MKKLFFFVILILSTNLYASEVQLGQAKKVSGYFETTKPNPILYREKLVSCTLVIALNDSAQPDLYVDVVGEKSAARIRANVSDLSLQNLYGLAPLEEGNLASGNYGFVNSDGTTTEGNYTAEYTNKNQLILTERWKTEDGYNVVVEDVAREVVLNTDSFFKKITFLSILEDKGRFGKDTDFSCEF